MSKIEKNSELQFVIVVAAIIAITFAAFWLFAYHIETDLEKIGTSFGIYSGFVSGLALMAALYTLRKQQILVQNQENSQFTERFERKFFQLLSLHQSIREDLLSTYAGLSSEAESKGFFLFIIRRVTSAIPAPQTEGDEASRVLATYGTIYDQFVSGLGHYFRNLYHLFKYLDRYKDPEKLIDKIYYSQLIRSQLSDAELTLIALNAASTYGKDFHQYLLKYKLTHNINVNTDYFKRLSSVISIL